MTDMNRRKKRILLWLIVAALPVLYFVGITGVCSLMGHSRIKASAENWSKVWFSSITKMSRFPPGDDFHSAYRLLKVAATSPFYSGSAEDSLRYYVQRAAMAAYFFSLYPRVRQTGGSALPLSQHTQGFGSLALPGSKQLHSEAHRVWRILWGDVDHDGAAEKGFSFQPGIDRSRSPDFTPALADATEKCPKYEIYIL